MRTLLLDCNYFPVKIISWQKAMILFLTERAEVVDEYEDKLIRSVSTSYKLPKVLRLFQTHKISQNVKFSRMNVFFRDQFKCQYCEIQLAASELTFDHIIPVSQKGATNWENVVTCCKSCNTHKGSKTLKAANMKLLKVPKKPRWSPELCLRPLETDPVEWRNFFPTRIAS
ncbi:MAG: HNH endonuclease [Bacteriovorax sp.]|nr:HNH endonuclease [Bacteriovorax sp.]